MGIAGIRRKRTRTNLVRAAKRVGYLREGELGEQRGKILTAENMADSIINRRKRPFRAFQKRLANPATREHAQTLDYQERPILDEAKKRVAQAKERLKRMRNSRQRPKN